MPRKKHAVILCAQDGFANGVKPREITAFLKNNGYSVEIRDTSKLSRLGTTTYKRLLPAPQPGKLFLYSLEAILATSSFLGLAINRRANSLLLRKVLTARGRLLSKSLARSTLYDLLICESNFDQTVMLQKRVAKTQILDLPAPFAEELYYGKLLNQRAYEKFRTLEIATYTATDHLSFHWHTYIEYVKKNKYNGRNFISLTYGTTIKNKSTTYAKEPRIIFLGYLSGYWVNLPLLSKLCKSHPNIDVYGGPEPPAELGINYKGYAPTTDVIAEYQFGLITISDDALRKHSFSSKHLEYISYGLPVLTPGWRKDKLLDNSSIYYTPSNFLKQLAAYSSKQEWDKKHSAALATAAQTSWENALKPLLIVG